MTPMPGKPRISVVFPAFNEEMNLETVITSACRILPDLTSSFEIIIVRRPYRCTAACARDCPTPNADSDRDPPHNLG